MSPALGRFISPSPLTYPTAELNYQFCGNNPVIYIDLWGLVPKAMDYGIALNNSIDSGIDTYLDFIGANYNSTGGGVGDFVKFSCTNLLQAQAFVAKTVLGIPGSFLQWGRGSGENSAGYDMNGCPLTPGGVAMNAVEDILNTVNAAMAARGMINAFNGMRSVINQGTKAAASEVWGLPPTARGRIIEEAFGGNLPGNYPVIDKFVDGVATSIKSIDLNASTYQSASALKNKIVDYIDKLIEFQGRDWALESINASQINAKELLLIIPRNGTAAQQAAINETIKYGSSNGILVTVRIMP